MKGDDDIHSLLQWCIEKELEAHNNANIPRRTKGSTECERHGWYMREKSFTEMIEKIRSMRVNQKPHIVVGGEPLP